MAIVVAEVMNADLFSVCAEEAAGDVVAYFLALGIGGAPVLDDEHRVLGFVSLRDLVDAPGGMPVSALMSTPADVVPSCASIREAAALMARRARHHLVVVDVDGRAVGFLSLLDVVRGLIGAPASHPSAFSHRDPCSGLEWTDPIPLGLGTIDLAPSCAGVLLLIDGSPDRHDRVVWSEATQDVRARLVDLAHRPDAAPTEVREAALRGHLWFRAATTPAEPSSLPAGPYARARE